MTATTQIKPRESTIVTSNPSQSQEFGPHLMLDCRGCNPEKISNLQFVFDVLNSLPEAIGMTKITQPYVFPYSGLVPEDKGITGVVIIAESHLTFHSFTEKDYFFFDLFSCKQFNVEAAVEFITQAFEVKEYDRHMATRGVGFPRSEYLSGQCETAPHWKVPILQ